MKKSSKLRNFIIEVVYLLWYIFAFPFRIFSCISTVIETREYVKYDYILSLQKKIPSVQQIKIKGIYIPFIYKDLNAYIVIDKSKYVMDLLMGGITIEEAEKYAKTCNYKYVGKINFIIKEI